MFSPAIPPKYCAPSLSALSSTSLLALIIVPLLVPATPPTYVCPVILPRFIRLAFSSSSSALPVVIVPALLPAIPPTYF